jgi:hypothetical protein
VPSTVIDESGVSAGELQPGRLKALVFLPSIAYYRMFESLLAAMLAAGHQVLVALDHDRRSLPPDKAHLLAEQLPPRGGPWRIAASAIRRSLDYLRYLEPEYAAAEPLREQARDHAPRAVRALLVLPPFRWELGRRPFAWLLHRVEAGIPRPRGVKSFITGQAPDVVIVSPLAEFGSPQADYVRSAAAARIPSVLVASEDDLTSKGVIRDVPTLTVTWSEAGVNEMVRFHGFPRERIVAVGAQRSNGRQVPAARGTLEAIKRAARMEVVSRREGRLLRPLLWLLTPLLAVVLLLFRPRAIGRAAIRSARRLRKRARTLRRTMSHKRAERPKSRARAAKEEKLARAEAVRQQKMARAKLKGQERARAEGEKQLKAARAKTAPAEAATEPTMTPRDRSIGGDKASTDAAKETEKSRG